MNVGKGSKSPDLHGNFATKFLTSFFGGFSKHCQGCSLKGYLKAYIIGYGVLTADLMADVSDLEVITEPLRQVMGESVSRRVPPTRVTQESLCERESKF